MKDLDFRWRVLHAPAKKEKNIKDEDPYDEEESVDLGILLYNDEDKVEDEEDESWKECE